MNGADRDHFSGPVTAFHERRLPEPGTPVGYAALIDTYLSTSYGPSVPMPRQLSAIGSRHREIDLPEWRLYTPRHQPEPSLEGHLTFALKYEGLDLAVLKRLFLTVAPANIEAIVRATPTGSYARRIWFLYEWLTQKRLDVPSVEMGAYIPALDPTQQWGIDGENSPRHRVRNNLPGTPDFCPLASRTPGIENFIAMNLPARARDVVNRVPRDLLTRAASFLLLKDSKSSYIIEGERPPQDRIQRWGRAIGQAGRAPLDLDELLRLQRIVIGDERFVHLGLRHEGGFVGEHDRQSQNPIPDHISARPEDLPSLVQGLIAYDHGAEQRLDAVIAAAILAFGFVYIHPFHDGNGRLHRYLIHHVLARRGYNPPGIHFPVSAAILKKINAYLKVLESYSSRLLPVIQWEPTENHNVRVLNDTADFYRFFDATPHVEFLYACVRQTIEQDLPNETKYLERSDRFRTHVESIVDMPDRTFDNLLGFLRQNEGHLSKRAREKEFAALTEEETRSIEQSYIELFGADTGAENAFLAQPLDFNTVTAYTKRKFPDLEPKDTLTKLLLRDIDLNDYPKLLQLDEAVNRARTAVEAYRFENPDWFRYSTDFLTKSLGFVDQKFRAKHGFASKTRNAFQRFEHLVDS
jgi:Fic/DOC family